MGQQSLDPAHGVEATVGEDGGAGQIEAVGDLQRGSISSE